MTEEHPVADAPDALLDKTHRRGGLWTSGGIVREWWLLRISAALLVPLSIWFVVSLVTNLLGADQAAIAAWLKHLPVTIAMVVMLAAAFIHTRLGLHEIIIDYAHGGWKKLFVLVADLSSLVLGVGSIAAIIHLYMA